MDIEDNSVWAVVEKINPHIPHQAGNRTVVVYRTQEEAANFILLHPQYHYKVGIAEPKLILELKEIKLGETPWWWNPTFP